MLTDKAEELEKNIIKIAVKGYLLVENKAVKVDDFMVADKPLRDAFELMVKVFKYDLVLSSIEWQFSRYCSGRNRVKKERITEAIEKIVELLHNAEAIITNLLAPHLQSKNMLRITSSFGMIADVKFLDNAFSDAELEDDLEQLVDAMEYYTQFHW